MSVINDGNKGLRRRDRKDGSGLIPEPNIKKSRTRVRLFLHVYEEIGCFLRIEGAELFAAPLF